ncbi:MAG: bifunctional riboflavin kinase/FAD synthetase [Xenococcaceae cyanobacterium MO_234.B1]|nr:bifunctional riboflavin kinase/FAD synthetase [Xenococcaceae cyanobacterium MO_234.B1]
MWIATSTDEIRKPTAIALGNFDGIHQGHRVVLQPLLNTSNASIYPSVVSFTPHPREFFTGDRIQLLTPVAEKAQYLASLGIKQLVLLPFDRELANLSPQQFVEEVLVRQLQVTLISVGEDFRFGYQRKGNATDLQNIAAKFDIPVQINTLHQCAENKDIKSDIKSDRQVRVSSSLIRQALLEGDISRANSMLGRSYCLMGKVIKGRQLGRTIGFPTANLQLSSDKLLPRHGVYAVKVKLDNSYIKGVMNIGSRPTVSRDDITVEVHLINWSGNLYDQNLTVYLERFLRPEQKFASLDALKEQIMTDCQLAWS